jgi:hypothetical protein
MTFSRVALCRRTLPVGCRRHQRPCLIFFRSPFERRCVRVARLVLPNFSKLILYAPRYAPPAWPSVSGRGPHSRLFRACARADGQLLLDRDAHGNVSVSKIETERLLVGCVLEALERLRAEGKYGGSFKPQYHFFGYEGRSCLPSAFDVDYCYALGFTAGALIGAGFTGYTSSISNLGAPGVLVWLAGLPNSGDRAGGVAPQQLRRR